MVDTQTNKPIRIPIQDDTLNLDSLQWIDNAFYQSTTLDDIQERVGILPTAKSSFSGRPDKFVLPGQGKPYPDCGEPIIYLCPRCGHLKKNEDEGKNCRRATCPKCYHTWAWLLAKKAANRISQTPGIQIINKSWYAGWAPDRTPLAPKMRPL